MPIVKTDFDMVITYCNASAEIVFGYNAGELIGQKCNILMTPSDAAQHDDYVAAYERTGCKKVLGILGWSVVGQRKDGTTLTLQLTTSASTSGESVLP